MGIDRTVYAGFGAQLKQEDDGLPDELDGMEKPSLALQVVTAGYADGEPAHFVFLRRTVVEFSEDDKDNFACIPMLETCEAVREDFQAAVNAVEGLAQHIEPGSLGWYVALHVW